MSEFEKEILVKAQNARKALDEDRIDELESNDVIIRNWLQDQLEEIIRLNAALDSATPIIDALFSKIDRMNDITDEDTAEIIIEDLLDEIKEPVDNWLARNRGESDEKL